MQIGPPKWADLALISLPGTLVRAGRLADYFLPLPFDSFAGAAAGAAGAASSST